MAGRECDGGSFPWTISVNFKLAKAWQSGRKGLVELLDDRKVTVLPFSAWEKIDSEEKTQGSYIDKPREKLSSWQELLKVGSE